MCAGGLRKRTGPMIPDALLAGSYWEKNREIARAAASAYRERPRRPDEYILISCFNRDEVDEFKLMFAALYPDVHVQYTVMTWPGNERHTPPTQVLGMGVQPDGTNQE